jgi:ABC-type Fe3+-hydroxamate transport system substrate-binding protein
MRPPNRSLASLAAAALVASIVASCSSLAATPSPTQAASGAFAPYGSYAPSARPSTTAKLTIVSPTADQVVTGATVHVVVSLTGATIVDDTNEDIRPDQGHVHLYLNNALIYMQYGLTKDLPVNPGTYVLKAEFVANDHFPFNPRDWSSQVFFTVK